MSEGNVPPRNNDSDSLDSAARADQTPDNSPARSSAYDDWEVVPLAGMPPLGDDFVSEAAPPAQMPVEERPKEADWQARIHDLNQCNEVLLARVHQLEEALERSQQALQQEVERSQHLTKEQKVAAAQNHSVAELLRDLEQSNAALERQTILAETLSAQLQTFQERSEQLEQECAFLRQQNLEKTQHLQTAEETCADLRSRLQRQQRYTLQFKAALEKCLDASAFKHTSSKIEADSQAELDFSARSSPTTNPLVMPRSERIQPWSASASAAQADPHLLSLMRSQPLKPEPEPTAAAVTSSFPTSFADPISTPSPAAATETGEAGATDSEAEQQLWQDVERVIENTTEAAAPFAAGAPTTTPDSSEEAQFTEPIPWGAPVPKDSLAAPAPDAGDDTTIASQPVHRREAAETFTETRSPADNEAATTHRPPHVPDAYRQTTFTASIPALDAMKTPQSSPSPVVHPLKPTQRKRKSLSAVELPSFPPLPKVEN